MSADQPGPAARSVIGAAIIREYELADPDDQGFRPEAFTLAGAVLNALSRAGYTLAQEVDPGPKCRWCYRTAADCAGRPSDLLCCVDCTHQGGSDRA